MLQGYEKEMDILEIAILNKEKNCWICGVEVKLSSYHTNVKATAKKHAEEIIRVLHEPVQKIVKKTRVKRQPKYKIVNQIKYIL